MALNDTNKEDRRLRWSGKVGNKNDMKSHEHFNASKRFEENVLRLSLNITSVK